MEKRNKDKKILIDKDFFLKFVKSTENRLKALETSEKQAAESRAANLGFDLKFIDEKELPIGHRFVRVNSFTEEMKVILTKYKVASLSGSFDIAKNKHGKATLESSN